MKHALHLILPALLAAAVSLRAADSSWEDFPDGSRGQITEYRGAKDTPIAAAGFISHFGEATPRWTLALTFAGIAAVGVLLGRTFAARLPVAGLRQIFAVMILATGGFVVWQSL